MTFLHFVTCSLATFLPQFIVYRGTGLYTASGTFTQVFWGFLSYAAAQLLKLVVIALLFTSFEEGPAFITGHEVVKLALVTVDIAVVWLIYKRLASNTSAFYRLLGLGLGWSIAHHVAYYLPGYWIDARSLQFSYKSIFEAVSSEFSLILLLCMPFLIQISFKRSTTGLGPKILSSIGLFLIFVNDSVVKYLTARLGFDEITTAAYQLISAIVVAGITNMSWMAASK